MGSGELSPVIDALRNLVGPGAVLSDPDELIVYECDGFPIAKGRPLAVAFPTDTGQVAQCVKLLAAQGLQIVARGSGTGLAGGAVAYGNGIILSTSRMTDIESIDLENRIACVQAGVRNLALSEAVAAACVKARLPGVYHFSPDPSSQRASTIGGNAATNAGGINTLKHGLSTHHLLGMEFVTVDGRIHQTRPWGLCDGIGPDLPALLCGSEGTLALVTRLWCKLVPKPIHTRTLYAVFDSTEDACQTVADTIAAGILPTSMEMMDGAMIRVVEEAFHYGFPPQAQALLLIEIDGLADVLDEELSRIVALCHQHRAQKVEHCSDPQRRVELWSARKKAFGAIGRISRSYCTQDACVPRSMLPTAMKRIGDISAAHGLKITSVFHAGDGNVHPILLFDEDNPEDVQRILYASEEILDYCLSIGGTITGEHGVGVEKLHLMSHQFTPATIRLFRQIKDTFDPQHVLNDGKLIPSPTMEIQLLKPASINVPGGAG